MSERMEDTPGEERDPGPDDRLDEQAGKGYGSDEGEREQALPEDGEQQ